MNIKKGLVGVFVLFFLISGIGLGLLVLDDQNDLSSRAATGISSSLRPALGKAGLPRDDSLWQSDSLRDPLQIRFNKLVWLPPTEKDNVFLHLGSPVTVRIFEGAVDLPALKDLLGENFTSAKVLSSSKSYLEGWRTDSYAFNFFGLPKIVEVWTNTSGISLIAVMADETARADIGELAKEISPISKVKGISTPDDSARLAAVVRPSVVMILNNYCAKIKYTDTIGALLAGKTYPFCLAQVGSGFFVNKDGYIATNGHVVTNLTETTLVFAVLSGNLDNLLTDYFQAYFTTLTGAPANKSQVEQKVKDAHKSKETMYQMAESVDQLLKKNLIKLESPENKYYVQLSSTPIQLSKSGVNVGKNIVPATFVDADYEIPNAATGFSSSDVALIKIEGTGYPALPLGQIEEVGVGSDILLVGFPGTVAGNQSELLDTSANAEPTFTKGVVSAFKQAKGDKKNLIQTDASINHGNSGGPAISSKGNVIGIATYGIIPEEGSGNYNFLRDIADLKSLMSKNNVSEDTGETYTAWKRGLDNYWISYLGAAKPDFEKVSNLYENHPTIGKYLAETNAKIGTPEDKTPRFTRSQRKLYMNLSGGVMAFSILAIIVLTISDFIDTKRRSLGPTLPPQPVQTF